MKNSLIKGNDNSAYRTIQNINAQSEVRNEILLKTPFAELTSSELIFIGSSYNEEGDHKTAVKYFDEADHKLKQENLPASEQNIILANIYFGLGVAARETDDTEDALRYFMQAKSTANAIKENSDDVYDTRYHIHRNLGIALLKRYSYISAAEEFCVAIKMGELLKNKDMVACVKSYYGMSLALSGDLDQGLAFLLVAKESFSSPKDSLDVASHHCHMGRALERSQSYLDALYNYRAALEMRLKLCKDLQPTYAHSRLGDAYFGVARCLLKLHQEAAAVENISHAYVHYQEIDQGADLKKIQELLAIHKLELNPRILNASHHSRLYNTYASFKESLSHHKVATAISTAAIATLATAATIGLTLFARQQNGGSEEAVNAERPSARI